VILPHAPLILTALLKEEAIKDPHVYYIFLGHAEERVSDFLCMVLAGDKKKLRDVAGIRFCIIKRF
jgi:hypothetical protein